MKAISTHEIQFTVSVNGTSPFLFLELRDELESAHDKKKKEQTSTMSAEIFGANAGWFSDNNFVAEVGQSYELKYTSYSAQLDIATFNARIQARALQHAYKCDLQLSMNV